MSINSFSGDITSFSFTNPHDLIIYTQNLSNTEKIYKLRLDSQDPTKDVVVKLPKDVEENKLQEYFQITIGVIKENQKSYLVQKDDLLKKIKPPNENVDQTEIQDILKYIFNKFKEPVPIDHPPIHKLPPELWENIASYASESLQTICQITGYPKLTQGTLDAFNHLELSTPKLGFKTLKHIYKFIKKFGEEITRLNLEGFGDKIDNKFINEIVSLCPNLQHLSIPKSTINMEGLQKILSLLKLETLDVTDCEHITNDYKDISLEHKNLKKLDLSGTQIKNEGLRINFPHLTNLSLSTDDFLSLIDVTHLEYLSLRDSVVTDKGLQEILERSTNLKTLELLSCSNIKKIDAPFAETVICLYCEQVSELHIPKAKEIDVLDCEALQEIVAPLAERIHCSGCPLPQLDVPKAKKIVVLSCDTLKEINTPLAEKVVCLSCRNLSQLTAPNAKEIDVSSCDALQEIVAPLTEKVKCSYCKQLSQLYTPNAKEIDVSFCSILDMIDAPLAEKVKCSHCEHLSQLYILYAKEIDVSHCDALKEIVVSHAEKVKCADCQQLSKLYVYKAKEIDVLNCYVLQEIDAPLAERVKCSDCKLSRLYVPNAKEIDVSSCDALREIVAPLTEKLKCSYCEHLSHLHIPKVKEFDLWDCKAIEQIDAPLAEKVKCSYCEHLSHLYVSKAKEINVLNCYDLQEIDAPLANIKHNDTDYSSILRT